MKHCNFFKIGVFTLLSLLLAVSTASSKPAFLPDLPKKVFTEIIPAVVYPYFEYKGLTPSCSNYPGSDTEFSFFAKGGKKNKLVIFFQGGGACWDTKNCLYVPQTYRQEVSSIDMFDNTSGMGIFDTANKENPFKDWYYIIIPYCTGDLHWGASDHDYIDYLDLIPDVDSWTIRHRGAVNFQVVLQWLKDNFESPDQIFVTGSSAGGYGAIMSSAFIKETYPCSSVSVIGDSANGVTEPYFHNKSIYNWDIEIPTWIGGFEDGYTPAMTIADLYKNIANYYDDDKVGQFTTAWDWNQILYYNIMLTIGYYSTAPPPDNFVPQTDEWFCYKRKVSSDWKKQMYTYAVETAEDASFNYRYYIAAGTYHTIMMSDKFYTEDSAGRPFIEWVNAMVEQPIETPGGESAWQNLKCKDCGNPLPFFPCHK